jgi:hypothetical protein
MISWWNVQSTRLSEIPVKFCNHWISRLFFSEASSPIYRHARGNLYSYLNREHVAHGCTCCWFFLLTEYPTLASCFQSPSGPFPLCRLPGVQKLNSIRMGLISNPSYRELLYGQHCMYDLCTMHQAICICVITATQATGLHVGQRSDTQRCLYKFRSWTLWFLRMKM